MGVLMFAAFALGMLGVIGVLAYFLFFSEGTVAITQRDGQLTLSTGPVSSPQPEVGQPAPVGSVPRQRDPVMGGFAAEFTPGTTRGRPSGLVSGMAEDGADAGSPGVADAMPPTPDEAPTDPAPTDPATEAGDAEVASEPTVATEPMPESPVTPDSPPELTDEMITQADQALQRVEELIASANWKEMKRASEQALQHPMNDDQRRRAEALHEVADLATYYREGIEKAVSDLSVGNDFEVTTDFRVIVVEKGDDRLVVRYNEQNRSFRFDEFPFSLAHKLASFAMPDTAGAQAAKAVYQAIAPKATAGHREQSLDWLQAIDPASDEVDAARVIETLESLSE